MKHALSGNFSEISEYIILQKEMDNAEDPRICRKNNKRAKTGMKKL